jgi:hypothetical protein
MSAVQFYGTEKVIEAYDFKKIPSWSMWNGRAMLHKCETDSATEGREQLSAWLDMMEDSGSIDKYILKVYEDAAKINDKTPCDGSFTFRLVGEDQRQERQLGYVGNSAMAKELKELREWKEQVEAEPLDEPDNMMDRIGNIFINDPEKVPHIIAAVQSVLSMITGTKVEMPMQQIAAINGINSDAGLQQAIDILKRHDPRLPEHLTKLARLAEKDRNGFAGLLAILDNM